MNLALLLGWFFVPGLVFCQSHKNHHDAPGTGHHLPEPAAEEAAAEAVAGAEPHAAQQPHQSHHRAPVPVTDAPAVPLAAEAEAAIEAEEKEGLCKASTEVISQAYVMIVGADASLNISGFLSITQPKPDGPIEITGIIYGLTTGQHGFHVYTYGNLAHGCDGGGTHFDRNTYNQSGGQSSDAKRYAGDLNNLVTDSDGITKVDVSDSVLSLNGDLSIIGRLLVIDEQPDNYGGQGQTNDVFDYSDEAHPVTNKKIACGVVALGDSSSGGGADAGGGEGWEEKYSEYAAALSMSGSTESVNTAKHLPLFMIVFMILFMAL